MSVKNNLQRNLSFLEDPGISFFFGNQSSFFEIEICQGLTAFV